MQRLTHFITRAFLLFTLISLFCFLPPAPAGAGQPLPQKSAETVPVALRLGPDKAQPMRVPARLAPFQRQNATATATFLINYLAPGSSDGYGATCLAWNPNAQAAFTAAVNIWGTLVKSNVPIRINACWANLGSSTTLGYSGSSTIRDFLNAPLSNTWYSSALADSLAGQDLNPSGPDMRITYNNGFSWYYGTDANPPYNQVDFISVVMHEVGHGLNFFGSMRVNGGLGSWGGSAGIPNVYDTFVQNGSGQSLLNTSLFPQDSLALATQLTSNNLYFTGANASAANNNARVKIYAPNPWVQGSSYSHLDFNSFNNTVNQMMVYQISYGEAIHDPGPVGMGLLKDLGWNRSTVPVANPDRYTVDEDEVLGVPIVEGVLSNDSDPNGEPLTAEKLTNPANGALSFNANGSFVYTPKANWNGSDSFTYRASDGLNNSDSMTVTITVNPVNDAPVAENDSYLLAEDEALEVAAPGILWNDTDVEGSALNLVIESDTMHGTLNLYADGSFLYTPDTDYTGTDSFTYSVNDGEAYSNIASVTFVVSESIHPCYLPVVGRP